MEAVSGAGVPEPPKMPSANSRTPHGAIICWEEPVNNGAKITDYKLEWQNKADADFAQVSEESTNFPRGILKNIKMEENGRPIGFSGGK